MAAPERRFDGRPAGAAERPRVSAMALILLTLACVAVCMGGNNVLQAVGINYGTAGGNPLEKLHPSTFLVAGAFLVVAARNSAQLVPDLLAQRYLVYMLGSFALLLGYNAVILGGQASGIIDTFISPFLALYLLTLVSERQRLALAAVLHLCMIANGLVGLFEYAKQAPLIASQVVDYIDTGDYVETAHWDFERSMAFWGHPLNATLATGGYLLANLIARPGASHPGLRLLGTAVSLPALIAFGGRMAIVMFVIFTFLLGCNFLVKVLATRRVSRVVVLAGVVGVWLALVAGIAALQFGLFDSFLARLEDDNGSASTRFVALEILQATTGPELTLGDIYGNLINRQAALGTRYGVEIFWVAFFLRYGAIMCAIVYPALVLFVLRCYRDRGFAGAFLASYLLVVQSGSVGLAGKVTILTGFVFLIYALLPPERRAAEATGAERGRHEPPVRTSAAASSRRSIARGDPPAGPVR
jgi:hypothetical protein